MMRTILTALILLTGCESGPHCSIIHKPPAGCPAGWKELPGFFRTSERTVAACKAPAGAALEGCIDYLNPGETFSFTLQGLKP